MRGALGVLGALGAVAVLGVTGCAGPSDSRHDPNSRKDTGGSTARLSVHGAYMPQPVGSGMAGGYFTVRNTGDKSAELTSVTSGLAHHVQLHTTRKQRMQPIASLKVPANGELRLARGGNHLMFTGLKKKPVKGRKVPVTLHFAGHRPIEVSMPVRSTTYVPAAKPGK